MLWLRGLAIAPLISLGPGAYAAYIYTQAVLGMEYAAQPGNNERFFPLFLVMVVLGLTLSLVSWSSIEASRLPGLPARMRRLVASLFLGTAAFLLVGLHLPGVIAVTRGVPPGDYLDYPAAFWVVKLMDLALVVPAATATGLGLLRGARAATKAAYGVSGVFALTAASVTSMAVGMQVTGDPAAQPVMIPAFAALALAYFAVVASLTRLAAHESGPGLVRHEVVRAHPIVR
jgi:hypothetical protein